MTNSAGCEPTDNSIATNDILRDAISRVTERGIACYISGEPGVDSSSHTAAKAFYRQGKRQRTWWTRYNLDKMALTSKDERTLRIITILTFPPALIMLLVHGILAEAPVPALALIPLAASMLMGLHHISPGSVTGAGSGISLTEAHVAMIDTLVSITLFVFCILSWVFVPDTGYCDGGLVMLGTYGSVWIMLNCAIHAYLAFLHAPALVAAFSTPESPSQKGQRKFTVQNGYIKLAGDAQPPVQELPRYTDAGTSKTGDGYQPLP